jgi:hypothetical protein
MNTKYIINNYLKDNGYDGLCSLKKACSCRVDDLFICGSIPSDCRAGYTVKIGPYIGGWVISCEK